MTEKYIEHNLPLKEISHHSAIEKSVRHGHPSTLHIWWARKPLAASRAVVFSSLVNLPETKPEINKLSDLIKKIVPWEAVNKKHDNVIRKAQKKLKKEWGTPPKILDPFSGGGSIALEAQRLGCETYSNDYNPVSYVLQKATLEWPQKYGKITEIKDKSKHATIDGKNKTNLLYYLCEKWAKIILTEVKSDIGHLYPSDSNGNIPIGYIWMKEIECQNPVCGNPFPLTSHFYLVNKENNKIALKPIINEDKINFIIQKNMAIDFDPGEGTISYGKAKCPFCDQITSGDSIRKLARKNQLNDRLASVVLYNPNRKGKIHRVSDNEDYATFLKAKNFLDKKIDTWKWMDSPIPTESLATPHEKKLETGEEPFWVHMQSVNYSLNQYSDLFNTRQLLSMVTFLEKIKQSFLRIREDCEKYENSEILSEDLSKAIIGYLGILLDRLADKNSSLVVWNAPGEKIEHVFGRTSLPMMTWNYAELNPLQEKNGSWSAQLNWVLRFINNTSLITKPAENITCLPAQNLPYENDFFDAIITDPPYYDSVPYADLSDFFYVWLKRSIGEFFPEVFTNSIVPRKYDCVQNNSLIRRGKEYDLSDNINIKSKTAFENSLTSCFSEMYRVLKQEGIATIIYAHKTTDGWETMLNSLIKSNFVVTASWPIHTEMKERLRAKQSATLSSSIYMVCKKGERKQLGFWDDLRLDIRSSVESKLEQFWNGTIVGGDFFIAAIGPGMEVFSKYDRIETFSGNVISTHQLLEYIRGLSANYIISKLLKNGSNIQIDAISKFYLTYRWTFQNNRVEYDDARKLASAMGISLEDHVGRTGIISKRGKIISVLGPKDRGFIDSPISLIDSIHNSLLLWDSGEFEDLRHYLAETGYGVNDGYWKYCQAVSESLLPGSKEKQLLEGFLIGRDRYSDFSKVKEEKTKLDYYLRDE
jgi:putative DNA methylase